MLYDWTRCETASWTRCLPHAAILFREGNAAVAVLLLRMDPTQGVVLSHDNSHLAPDVYHPGRCAICANMRRQLMTAIAGTPSFGPCRKAQASMRRPSAASETRSQSQPRPQHVHEMELCRRFIMRFVLQQEETVARSQNELELILRTPIIH